MKTTALLILTKILWRIQETWEDLLSFSDSSEILSANTGVKQSQGLLQIMIRIILLIIELANCELYCLGWPRNKIERKWKDY